MHHEHYRILVSITFHYRADRLPYLFAVVRELSRYPVKALEIVIVTNTGDPEQVSRIESLCAPLLGSHPGHEVSYRRISVESHPNLSNPWHLPWCHKHLIRGAFFESKIDFTHYINLEDDILLSFSNFSYFVIYRDLLRGYRLIPSFHRVELNHRDNKIYLVDPLSTMEFHDRKRVDLSDWTFVNPDYPHNAMFILDRELAAEYITTRSFHREESVSVRPNWGLCERSAMGLCFESPPDGFFHRHVVPVDAKSLTLPTFSWVYHIATKYSIDPLSPFGKIEPLQLFAQDGRATSWSPPGLLAKGFSTVVRHTRQLWRGTKLTTGNEGVAPGLCPICGLDNQGDSACPRDVCPLSHTQGKGASSSSLSATSSHPHRIYPARLAALLLRKSSESACHRQK